MFVKLKGPDFIRFNPLENVRSWLTSHQSADSERNTNHPDYDSRDDDDDFQKT